jgi:hypothetical protein
MRRLLALLFAAALAGCVLFPGREDRALQKNPNFRQGYEDGCAAASTAGANPREQQPYRDEALYASDAAYRSGWGNGFSVCRGNTAPPVSIGNPALGH